MDTPALRQASLKEATRLGYPLNPELPLLDHNLRRRDDADIVARCLVLHVLIAVSYGFSRPAALAWLDQECLLGSVSVREGAFLSDASQEGVVYRDHSEAVWAFVWTLGITPHLAFDQSCSDDLVRLLPNLKTGESSSAFRARMRPRRVEEIAAAADLAYCLHWAVTEAALNGAPTPGPLPVWAVAERRRALDWILSAEDWDDVSLDT